MIPLPNTSARLLDQESYPALSPEHPSTPFSNCYAACQTGDLKQVKSLLTLDPSLITQSDGRGQTLLYASAAFNQLAVMQWLYEQNPLALKMCRLDGKTVMHIAVEKGHLEIVQWLYEKDPTLIDQADNNQLTPLHEAAFHEEISILKLFLTKLKANLLLIQQIAQKCCPKTLAFLLEQGIDPNHSNSSKQTLLHLAAEAGQEKNVLCLLQHGANVDARDCSQRTPLFLAVTQNHRSIVKLLIQNKADLTAVNEEHETLLHVAAAYGYQPLLEDLLNYPVCKNLMEAQDLDGKTALHKAVWGDQKYAIVHLLLEQGADPNAKNHYGYTPLHWAAKHGHSKSAQALLRNVDLVKSANDNHHLPFDLAIRFDQDDFIHFFLVTKARLQIGQPTKDIEGFYSKCLLQAKKENLVEEQILFLQKLSALYIEKENFLVGAKILNCAIALLDKQNYLFENYLLKKLEEIEKLFLKSLNVSPTIKIDSTKEKRARLASIRKTAAESSDQAKPIQGTLRWLTREFKQLLSELIAETQDILGPPPLKWACIGMGSMSRGEMCPYSDIEFAFLIEKESSKALDYFRALSKILEIKVINLGETKFPVFGGGYESPTPDGFCMDSAGNTPLGVTGVYELIGTPKQLAQFQSVKWMERNIILPNAMSNVCLVAGSEKLEVSYNKQKKKVQQLKEKKEGMQRKNDEELAMRLLGGHLIEFAPDLSAKKEKEPAFGVKKELYRPFQEILGCLSLLYDLKEKGTFGRIDELAQLNVFSPEGAENLKKAINLVLSLRLKVHLFYKDKKEFLCHSEQGKLQDPNLYYFTEENIVYLHEIYKILLPFHKAASEFYRTKNKEDLSKNSFYDDSPSVQGATFEKTFQYAKAQKAYQNTVSLNPNDIDAQLDLGNIEEKMGKSKEALLRHLKALTLAQQKYGENHPDVAHSYNNIGNVHYSLGDYDKALEFYQKTLKIQLLVLGENHPEVAACYNNIGLVYKSLGEYNKALEFCQKALRIWYKVLGENHPDVAISYNNIGFVYKALGVYDKELEFHQKALKIRLQVLGENHPDVATSYNNIGMIYDSLGDYTKALESHQKTSKIRLKVFGENHPDVATSYNNIGFVYKALGDYDKELEFHQKALKIRLQVLGENHPDVATSYNNIGMIYDSLGDYTKALEFHQKALKIRLQVLGENHTDIAQSYNNIGMVYDSLGDYEKALNHFRMAIEILCRTYKQFHPDILTVLEWLIGVAEKLQLSQRQSLKPTHALCVETLGAEHELTKKLLQLINA